MPILNYTTMVAAENTVAQIGAILAKAKCQSVMTEYDESGNPSAVSFRILTEFGLLTFRLPCDTERVFQLLCKQMPRTNRLELRKQSYRTAWRIVKDWVEAQCAMIQVGMVSLAQVFLPYAQDSTGTTLYENMKMRRFDIYALKDKE